MAERREDWQVANIVTDGWLHPVGGPLDVWGVLIAYQSWADNP